MSVDKFRMILAGQCIEISCKFPSTKELCAEYCILGNQTEEYPAIKVEINEKNLVFERKKSESEDIKEGIPIRHFSDEYLETLAVYRKIAEQMIACDTILFHGSVIAVDGVGYLFTAKSGTGKSTHTRLWREYFGDRAVMVNDDKPLLKITETGVTVCGTPWDGKHRLSNNITVPLKAICVLNRDERNHIEKVSGKDIYPLLLQQTYRSTDPVKMVQILKYLVYVWNQQGFSRWIWRESMPWGNSIPFRRFYI